MRAFSAGVDADAVSYAMAGCPTVLHWVLVPCSCCNSSLDVLRDVENAVIVTVVGMVKLGVFIVGREKRCFARPSLTMMRQNEIPMTGPIRSAVVSRALDRAKYMAKLSTMEAVHRTELSMKTYMARMTRDWVIRIPVSESKL